MGAHDISAQGADDIRELLSSLLRYSGGEAWPARLGKLVNLIVQMPSIDRQRMSGRFERGCRIAEKLGFSRETQETIQYVLERWDGMGYPHGLRGNLIPLPARLVALAQTAEVFFSLGGPEAARQTVRDRSGSWFDPEAAAAFQELAGDQRFCSRLQEESLLETITHMEPETAAGVADEARLDQVISAFADVVDVQSPFTASHSQGVATISERIARRLGLSADRVTLVRRASLLHDLGKMAVPQTILNKPARLSDREWETVRLHPYYTQRILEKAEPLREMAPIAAAHHEWLDGNGYYRHLKAGEISLEARIIAVADVFQALAADRPYRKRLETEQILEIMEKEVGGHLCPDIFGPLRDML